MAAKVTFGNLNGHTQPAPHVSLHTERLRAEPQPCPTPSASVGEGGTVRGGDVVHRHLSGEGTSVDREDESSVDPQDPLEQPRCASGPHLEGFAKHWRVWWSIPSELGSWMCKAIH